MRARRWEQRTSASWWTSKWSEHFKKTKAREEGEKGVWVILYGPLCWCGRRAIDAYVKEPVWLQLVRDLNAVRPE